MCILAAVTLTDSDSRQVKELGEMRKNSPYIHVFGRDSCAYTQRLLARLDEANVAYQYFSIDTNLVNEYLGELLAKAGHTNNYFDIPVVDVNRDVKIRPNADELVRKFRQRLSNKNVSGLQAY
jgi:hypothetical protein